MKNQNRESVLETRVKTVRNIFFVYLFASAVTGRYKIFAAICASFPFIIPVIFCDEKMSATERISHSFVYGIPGILVSVVFMLFTKSYSSAAWIVPALYGLLFCIVFSLVQKHLSAHKRTVMKCIISVFVCFLAFI